MIKVWFIASVDELDQSNPQYKPIDLHLLESIISSTVFSGRILYRTSVDSTNILARKLSEEGYPLGTIVVTDYQRSGRGRMSRKWLSDPGSNLLFSAILRPTGVAVQQSTGVKSLFLFNAIAAVAMVEAIRCEYGLKSLIKWPNDVYLAKKKLAGILSEFSLNSGIIEYVVVGVGLNVHWAPSELADNGEVATCIDAETGKPACRTRLLGAILVRMDKHYRGLEAGQREGILDCYKAYSAVLGKEIRVDDGKDVSVCRGVDILPDGTLVVVGRDGEQRFLRWGDVSLRL